MVRSVLILFFLAFSFAGKSQSTLEGSFASLDSSPVGKQKSDKCGLALNAQQISIIKQNLSSKKEDQKRLEQAREEITGKSLTSLQVIDVLKAFSQEKSRLEFAKFAYTFTSDKDNYGLLVDSFESENTVEELIEYINR